MQTEIFTFPTGVIAVSPGVANATSWSEMAKALCAPVSNSSGVYDGYVTTIGPNETCNIYDTSAAYAWDYVWLLAATLLKVREAVAHCRAFLLT